MSYPKKAIVAITVHGGIELDETDRPITFIPPRGMRITKLSAVVPGVCNIMNQQDADVYIGTILDNLKHIEDSKQSTKPETDSGRIRELGDMFRKTDAEFIVPDTEQVVRDSKREEGKADENDQQYLYHSDKSYQSTVYMGKPLINKTYSRSASDVLESTTPWDFTITVLNMPGFPDILREMTGRSHRIGSEVTLEEIADFLHDNGVREVIIIDFSCSIFVKDGDDITDTEEIKINPTMARALRRELLKSGLHGGKKRKTKKTKKNGSRKRRTVKLGGNRSKR